uniref:Nucleoporin NDC1 n=1 Tax=Myripristis murdjan TaxID=586833 RepID=A0A668AHV5_9TELE
MWQSVRKHCHFSCVLLICLKSHMKPRKVKLVSVNTSVRLSYHNTGYNIKAAASVAWAVLLLPPSIAVFVIISRVSLLHPIQWISECVSLLTSATAIFSFILLCGVVLIVGFLNLEYYTVIPSIACSKIALLGQLLHPRQFVSSLVHCILGVIVAWCCAVTIGGRYQTLGYPCTQADGSPQLCLNEYQVILLLAGAFVGYCHSVLGVIHNMNYVSFHTVQQYKYLRFKGSLPLVVKCSAIQALYSVRNYLVVYFFLGKCSLHPLDTIAGLLDFSLLYHLWISGTFLLFTWYITLLLFRIFVTEVYSFPVQSSFTEDVHQCLPKVLTGQQPAILKFLALHDLALLSQHSPSRRSEVFSLSQPGGHPHNWNAISQECLSLLADLTQRLVAHHDTVATNGRAKSLSTGSDKKSLSSESTEDVMTPRPSVLIKTPASVFLRSSVGSPLTVPFTPDLDSPFSSPALRRLAGPVEQCSPWHGTVQSPHIMRRGPKLWSTSTGERGLQNKTEHVIPIVDPCAIWANECQMFQIMTCNCSMLISQLLPEASSQALFADTQSHIWALEGLSYLVKASFSEDQFGVVQTTLPSILSSMLVLQEAVDRHFKLPHASSKPVRSTSSMEDSSYKTLRFALRATLKTAIYRITTTFGEHLNAVQMSAEHQKRLQQFLEYKE